MNRDPRILKPEEAPARKPWHLAVVVCGQILAGFLVAIFVCMLVTSFFPGLSSLWRAVLLVVTTAVFGFVAVWAQLLDFARRDEARRKGESIVDVPRRF